MNNNNNVAPFPPKFSANTANGDNIFATYQAACQAFVPALINNIVYKPETVGSIGYYAAMLNMCEFEADAEKIICKLAAKVAFSVPSEITQSQAEAFVNKAVKCNLKVLVGNELMPAKNAALQKLREYIRIERIKSQRFVSVPNDIEGVKKIESNYNDGLVKRILNDDGGSIYVLSGAPGSRKTSGVLKPLFEAGQQQNMRPMLALPKRILATISSTDATHVSQVIKKLETAETDSDKQEVTGVVSPAPTLIWSNEIQQHFVNSKMLLLDEYEEIRDHLATGPVGDNRLRTLAALNSKLDTLIKKTKIVVIANAHISEHSIRELIRTTGKRIVIVDSPESRNINSGFAVRINQSGNLSEKIVTRAASGESQFVFSDASNTGKGGKFRQLYKAVKHVLANDSTLIVDAHAARELGPELITGIDKLVANKQYVQASPAMSSGVSIEKTRFDHVVAKLHGAVLPTQVFQCIRRARLATDAEIEFNLQHRKHISDKRFILLRKIAQDESITEFEAENTAELLAEPGVQTVINRLAYNEDMRNNYANHVVFMLQHLGFKVEFADDTCEPLASKEAVKTSREEEKLERVNALISHSYRNDDADIESIRAQGDAASLDNKFALEAADLCSFYRQKRLDEQVIEFDRAGAGRNFVRNLAAAMSQSQSDDMVLYEILRILLNQKLFATLGINPRTLDGDYLPQQANEFLEWLNATVFEFGNKKIRATTAFNLVYRNANLSKTGASVVRSIMQKEFGVKVVETGKRTTDRNREKYYAIDDSDKKQQLVQYTFAAFPALKLDDIIAA